MTMRKITPGDPITRSADGVAENIAKLKALFPELVTEGARGAVLNVDVLKALVGDATVTDGEEKYGLNWHGKRLARQLALTPSTGTLRPCPGESVDWETTGNLMIEGDNLEVLKLLQKSYAGRVKMIYIDPLAHAEPLVKGRGEEDILFELLLKLGLELTVPMEQRIFAGKTVHSIGLGALMVCLAPQVKRSDVEPLAQGMIEWWRELDPAVPVQFVFRDSGFVDDVAKTNLAAILEQNIPADRLAGIRSL